MSSTQMKINTLEHPSTYSFQASGQEQIDLLRLLSVLYAAKKQLITITLLFALCGLAASFLLPNKWTSQAIITPPETTDVSELRHALVDLTMLNVETNVDAETLFKLFLKKYDSQELREQFLEKSPFVQGLLKKDDVNKSDLYRAIVNVAQKFTSVDNSTSKKSENLPYASWTLSFTAPDANDAQQILHDYAEFVTGEVKKDVLTTVKDAIALKIATEQEHLALDRVNLDNQHKVKLERLGYSLQVANAAGLKEPVYSRGQAIKDDPDYSVSLGAKGISEKLKIEESITDVSQLDASVKDREHALSMLQTINLGNIDFRPYQFQMQPALPLKKDGPGKALVIALAALIGLLVATGTVLVRDGMASRLRDDAL